MVHVLRAEILSARRAKTGARGHGRVDPATLRNGDCVRLPDGRFARIRGRRGALLKVRVRRRNGNTHQFLLIRREDLEPVACPKGWMSPDGYRRYLRVTLKKMRERSALRRNRRAQPRRS